MHLAPIIRDLAVILGVAGLVTLIFHRIRQPVVLGYVTAGILVGPYALPRPLVSDLPNIRIWADIGVIFLMFSLGLDFSFRKLAKVGISASLTACIEVAGMLLLGFALGRFALGWPALGSLFFGAMLAISSTTIILKALDDRGLKTRRFAEMIFAVLVVEDLLAMLLLVALSMAAVEQHFSGMRLLAAAAQLVLVIGSWFIFGYFVIPRVVRYVGRLGNEEMLTILALGLCFALVVMAAWLGYSVALGAFIMGSILSESTESERIENLIRPLRDLFGAIFFVSVGMLLEPRALAAHWPLILGVSAAYVIGKIAFVSAAALATGQSWKTAVQVGFGLATIGEFSFIIATLGQSTGATGDVLFPVAVAVSLITTFLIPYLIRMSHPIAKWSEARMPATARARLQEYGAWCQARRADAATRSAFYGRALRWFLNGLVVTAVFFLVGEFWETVEALAGRLGAGGLAPRARAMSEWMLSVVLSAPFLWAMIAAFRDFRFDARGPTGEPRRRAGDSGAASFVVAFLTVIWVGALSLKFLPARFALLLTGALGILLFASFYRRLERSYRWFERHFMSTFESSPKSRRAVDALKHLAPWDAHLVRLKVHPNAEIAGKRLAESGLRGAYGLNLVAIQRGVRSIVAPRPDETIYPRDELLVLGTDEQIEACRARIEQPPGLEGAYRPLSGYELKPIRLHPNCPLAGASIRESGIRERFNSIVVGVERGDLRMINPESTLRIGGGDLLWVVGEQGQLGALTSYLAHPEAPPEGGSRITRADTRT